MRPPETVHAGEIVLKRWEPQWAEAADTAIRESIAELAPFLPWVDDTPASAAFIERSIAGWKTGTEFNYAIFTAGGDFAGSLGLTTRMGPGVMEIGYWMRSSCTGRGYMTAAVRAIAPVAAALPGIERVVINHDAANAASAAVAAKAGFAEIGRADHTPSAPGETGTRVTREWHG